MFLSLKNIKICGKLDWFFRKNIDFGAILHYYMCMRLMPSKTISASSQPVRIVVSTTKKTGAPTPVFLLFLLSAGKMPRLWLLWFSVKPFAKGIEDKI